MNDEDIIAELKHPLSGACLISTESGVGYKFHNQYVAVPEYKACFGFSPSRSQFMDCELNSKSTPEIWDDPDLAKCLIKNKIHNFSWKNYAKIASHTFPRRYVISEHEKYKQVILFNSKFIDSDYVIVSCWDNRELFKVSEFIKEQCEELLSKLINSGNSRDTILITDSFDEAFVTPHTLETSWESIFKGD